MLRIFFCETFFVYLRIIIINLKIKKMGILSVVAIILLILLGLYLKTEFDYCESVFEKIWACIKGLIVTFIIWVIATSLIASIIGIFPKTEMVKGDKVQIVAISDGSATGGSFFLGCGSVKETSYYFYYKKMSNGGFKQEKIKVSDAIIFEDSTKAPSIQFYHEDYVNKGWHNWAILFYSSTAEIFVPKGSIVQNFNFDLK